MKNEKTSKRVAAIAGKVLQRLKDFGFKDLEVFACSGEEEFVQVTSRRKLTYPDDELFTVAELKALAASCLTQAPDKPPAKRRK